MAELHGYLRAVLQNLYAAEVTAKENAVGRQHQVKLIIQLIKAARVATSGALKMIDDGARA